MLLIGKFLKQTVHQANKRNKGLSASHELKVIEQQLTLHDLISDGKKTHFGIHYGLDKMALNGDFDSELKARVPLFNYERFYEQWLIRTLNDEKNVIYPGEIKHFALSSGTTSDSSKRIPVSEKMIRYFQKTTLRQIPELDQFSFSESFFESKILTVGGSTKLKKVGAHLEGDLSGILVGKKSFTTAPFARPKKKISGIAEWNEKMAAMIEAAPKWNIGVIAGVPSWVCLLMENIISHYKLNSIHDIWPNLNLYLHGGTHLEPYLERIEKCLSRTIHYQNTYLASEGYFAYQRTVESNGMELLTSNGIYYEFIEENYFDAIREGQLADIPTLRLDQIDNNKPYAMVITTCSGLWRYIIGDIISFTDINTCKMNIIGRISSTINVFGEHLSEGNMRMALQQVGSKLKINIEEFCVYPSVNNNRHNWYVGSNQKFDTNYFSVLLNDELSKLNDDYASLRKNLLKAPRIKALPVQKFYEYLEVKNKFGAQHKFPRVMTALQAKEWERFLTSSSYLEDYSSLTPKKESSK
jgi:hypothetical protein